MSKSSTLAILLGTGIIPDPSKATNVQEKKDVHAAEKKEKDKDKNKKTLSKNLANAKPASAPEVSSSAQAALKKMNDEQANRIRIGNQLKEIMSAPKKNGPTLAPTAKGRG